MIAFAAFLFRSRRIFTAALAAALGLGFSLAAAGQASAAADPAADGVKTGGVVVLSSAAAHALAPGKAAAVLSAGGHSGAVSQGIHIHGHWIIDVKNPDGTLAQHHEFDNAPLQGGATFLMSFLTGSASFASWGIALYNTNAVTPICGTSTTNYCLIAQSLAVEPGESLCQSNYMVCQVGIATAYNDSSAPYTLTLSGNMTASNAGSINEVFTYLGSCGLIGSGLEATAPSVCAAAGGGSNTYG